MLSSQLALDPDDIDHSKQKNLQSQIWTSLPGTIQSVDYEKMTCTVLPAIMGFTYSPDANGVMRRVDHNMPLLVDCPIHFQGSSSATFTFPVAKGDECSIHFFCRNMDYWYQNGGVVPQTQGADVRLHDLSDAYVIPGIRSQPNIIANGISQTEAQLRSKDGTTTISLNPTTNEITITSTSKVTINTPTLFINGNVIVNGEVTANDIPVSAHEHSGVQRGSANTDKPIA